MSQSSSVPLVKDADNLNFIVRITITVSAWMQLMKGEWVEDTESGHNLIF